MTKVSEREKAGNHARSSDTKERFFRALLTFVCGSSQVAESCDMRRRTTLPSLAVLAGEVFRPHPLRGKSLPRKANLLALTIASRGGVKTSLKPQV